LNKKSTTRPRAAEPAADAPGSPRFGWPAAAIYLALVTIICYLPALLPGRTFLTADLIMLMPPWSYHAGEIAPGWHAAARPAWDPIFQFYPSRKFLAEAIHAGAVPWRNPYSNAGTPFIADDQSAFFYPINWLFAVLPLASAFGIVAALHTFLAGLFFTLFARAKRLCWEAALAGATVWMLCGVMVAWQMWQVVDATLCWMPLGLYFVGRTVDRGSVPRQSLLGSAGAPLGLAVTVGMILTAGHLQFGFYDLAIIGCYAVFRMAVERAWKPLAQLAGSLLLGLGIAAAQILPTLELLHNSLRSNYSLATLLQTALPVSQLGLMVMPEIAGGQRSWMQYPFQGAVNYYEVTSYFGASALVFAGLAFCATERARRSVAWFWLGIAALGILIGCGSPLYDLAYHGLPLFKSFHGVARTLVLTDFAVASLCALGIQSLVDLGASRRAFALRAGVAAALIVVGLYGIIASRSSVLLASLLTHDWLGYGLAQLERALALVVAGALVAVFAPKRLLWTATVVVAADMLWFAAGLNPGAQSNMLYPAHPIVDVMARTEGDGRVLTLGAGAAFNRQIIPNSAMSIGLRDIEGSDPLLLKDYDRFGTELAAADSVTPLAGGQDSFAHGRCGALDFLNVRAVVSPVPLASSPYPLVSADDVFVYSNPGAVGEARFAGSWAVNVDSAAGVERLFASDPGRTVLLTSVPLFGKGTQIPGMPPHGDLGTMGNARLSLESVSTQARTPAPDIAVFSEIADPAWKAYVDGSQTAWVTVDGLFVGVPVVAGDHRVELRYLPDSGLLGLYFTCMALSIAAGWAWWSHGARDSSAARRTRSGESGVD
jgi:hypothetical protein